MPIAVNWVSVPLAIVESAGVTEIDSRTAAVTDSGVEPTTAPLVAVTLTEPTASVDTRPCEPAVFETVAIAADDVPHVAVVVSTCVVPSVYVPVATNCCVRPLAIDGLTGVTAIDTSAAAVTVSVVVPLIAPLVAVIVVEPVATV